MNALELAQKLAEARELVDQAIVKNCPVPVVYSDRDGRWCRVNEPMEKLLAEDNGDLIGIKWQKLLADKAQKKEWEAAVKTKAETMRIALRFKTSDGRLVASYCSLIRLTNGDFIGFVIPVCDHPSGCPVHGFLLHNIENGSTQVRG